MARLTPLGGFPYVAIQFGRDAHEQDARNLRFEANLGVAWPG